MNPHEQVLHPCGRMLAAGACAGRMCRHTRRGVSPQRCRPNRPRCLSAAICGLGMRLVTVYGAVRRQRPGSATPGAQPNPKRVPVVMVPFGSVERALTATRPEPDPEGAT